MLQITYADGYEYLAFVQVRIMKKRLVRKTFDMVEEIANRENKEVRFKEHYLYAH